MCVFVCVRVCACVCLCVRSCLCVCVSVCLINQFVKHFIVGHVLKWFIECTGFCRTVKKKKCVAYNLYMKCFNRVVVVRRIYVV